MPTFDTPEPISATIGLSVGDLRIVAGDGGSTIVDIRPTDASNAEDVKAAEHTRVEYSSGALLVKSPKLRSWSLRGGGPSVDVTIELPAGSNVQRHAVVGRLPLRGPARRMPDQDRARRHLGRAGRDREPEDRARRHHRRAGHRRRRADDRLGRRARTRRWSAAP